MLERRDTAKSLQFCFCCLRRGHCFKVYSSKYNCRHSNQPHNTLLHQQKSPSAKLHAKEKSLSNSVANKSKVNSTCSAVAILVHEICSKALDLLKTFACACKKFGNWAVL